MPFDLQPVLTGERLVLRPLQAEDFDSLFEVASDPLIWEQHPVSDRYQRDVFEGFFKESLDSGGAMAALDPETGRIIGSSRFYGYDEAGGEIEIGWSFLNRTYWGGVYNREMKHLMLAHAFKHVNAVVFLVGPENYRSRRAMEKIGAHPSGSRRNDTGHESIVYTITKEDYLERGLNE